MKEKIKLKSKPKSEDLKEKWTKEVESFLKSIHREIEEKAEKTLIQSGIHLKSFENDIELLPIVFNNLSLSLFRTG